MLRNRSSANRWFFSGSLRLNNAMEASNRVLTAITHNPSMFIPRVKNSDTDNTAKEGQSVCGGDAVCGP